MRHAWQWFWIESLTKRDRERERESLSFIIESLRCFFSMDFWTSFHLFIRPTWLVLSNRFEPFKRNGCVVLLLLLLLLLWLLFTSGSPKSKNVEKEWMNEWMMKKVAVCNWIWLNRRKWKSSVPVLADLRTRNLNMLPKENVQTSNRGDACPFYKRMLFSVSVSRVVFFSFCASSFLLLSISMVFLE